MNFNIHDLLRFTVNGTNKRILRHIERDYSYFQTVDDVESDFDVIVGDFAPSTDGCYIVDGKYYVKQDYLFCKDGYKIVNWSLSIEDIEGKPRVRYEGGLFSGPFLRDYVLEPLIGFCLARKGHSLVHASGVAFGDKGFVFPACQGVGKTSTMLNLVEDGAIYLSNEPIIMSNDGRVYSFPSHVHFYHYNLTSTPSFSKRLSAKERLELELKHLIYLLSFKYGSFPLNVDPRSSFKEIGGSHRLAFLVILTKTAGNEVRILENSDRKRIVKKLVAINQFEMRYLSNCLRAYSYVFPEAITSSHWEVLERNLTDALSDTTCCEVEIPLRYDPEVYRTIHEFVRKNLPSQVE